MRENLSLLTDTGVAAKRRKRAFRLLACIGIGYVLFEGLYECARLYRQYTNPIPPPGYTAKEERFDPHGFQDYTDYCKY